VVKRKRGGALSYGWRMLLGLSVAEVMAWGILNYSFSVFLNPMRDALGWSTAELTSACSLPLLLSMVAPRRLGTCCTVREHGHATETGQ
jgi:hypothetical protein